MSFDYLGLSDELLSAIKDAGYTEPTPIQKKAIPSVLQGRDILAIAQTGTGKTAGFTLPLIDILAQGRARARMPRSLILEPTRELAAQVEESFDKYGKNSKLSCALLIGGTDFAGQVKKLDKGVDVLIATPGRLYDLALSNALKKMRDIPQVHFIKRYYHHPLYIEALANTVRQHWTSTGRQAKLFFSFHGIPKSYADKGDPYPKECINTAHLVAEALELSDDQWQLSYQSRVGAAEWLKPYTDETMKTLGKANLKGLDVICPGFSADCLETIEEIDEENREYFEEAGGSDFHYIPALNDQDCHIDLLEALVNEHL